jgi:hypothetical protein
MLLLLLLLLLLLTAPCHRRYNHNCPTCAAVPNVAAMDSGRPGVPGIDQSRMAFQQAAVVHAASKTNSALWITETAFSVDSPVGAPGGGAKATIDGMCRAADIAWNLDALGAAAEVRAWLYLSTCIPASQDSAIDSYRGSP